MATRIDTPIELRRDVFVWDDLVLGRHAIIRTNGFRFGALTVDLSEWGLAAPLFAPADTWRFRATAWHWYKGNRWSVFTP
jgi:hypothetical protein